MSDVNDLVEIGELFRTLELDLSRTYIDFDSDSALEVDFDISEYEFLEFAENDLKQNNTHGFVNALSNAKRAIDCQVDKVLMLFGFQTKRNFPQKIELLREMGLAAPRIINKVVRARNYMEHEYKSPDQSMAEDAVDVATLFIMLTDKSLQFFPSSFRIGSAVPERPVALVFDKLMNVVFDFQNKQFSLTALVYEGERPPLYESLLMESHKYKNIGHSILTPKDEKYKILIQLALLGARPNVDPDEFIPEFIEKLCAKSA